MDIDGARARYLECLASALGRSDARLLAYCLMSNHVHLVLQLGVQPLGSLMKSVNTGWAIWINRQAGRLGAVFADRPGSVLCDSQRYALELVRYVHNNPVRAGVVERAEQSAWSSHRAYIGAVQPPDWLCVEPVLQRLGDDIEDARRAFVMFVDGGNAETRRPEFAGVVSRDLARHIRSVVGGAVEISYPVLGSDEFILEAFREQVGASADAAQFEDVSIGARDVLVAVCRELELDPAQVASTSRERSLSHARAITAWIWSRRLGKPQAVLTQLFNRSAQSVSEMIRRIEEHDVSRREFDRIERIIRRLRTRMIELLQQRSSVGGDRSEVLLLQRLREVEERLFGPVVYPPPDEAPEHGG